MVKKQSLKVFEEKRVRSVWDDEEEKWYFSVVDVVGILTESVDAQRYWSVLKVRIKKDGREPTTICSRLKLQAADGKMRMTDVADTEQMFRIIQSIPSPNAEPFKQWMARVARERIDQMQDPELSISQAVADYRRLGYSEAWINERVKGINARKEMTDEWQRTGVRESRDFALLTDILTKEWSGKTTKQYKQFKGLKKENLRDNMTTLEMALNTLAEASATALSRQRNPNGVKGQRKVAKDGGSVAKVARDRLEAQLGRSVVTSDKASDYLIPRPDADEADTEQLE